MILRWTSCAFSEQNGGYPRAPWSARIQITHKAVCPLTDETLKQDCSERAPIAFFFVSLLKGDLGGYLGRRQLLLNERAQIVWSPEGRVRQPPPVRFPSRNVLLTRHCQIDTVALTMTDFELGSPYWPESAGSRRPFPPGDDGRTPSHVACGSRWRVQSRTV